MFFICFLQLLASLIGLLRRGDWAWFFRVAKDHVVTLTTLVRISFLVSVTEYQACTFPQGMWGRGIGGFQSPYPSLLTLGLHWESSRRSLQASLLTCRAPLYYTGIIFSSWWQMVVRRQHLLSHAHLDLFTHRKLFSFPKESLSFPCPLSLTNCYPR